MKRSELIKGCLLGLMVVGLMLFGSLPAMAQVTERSIEEFLAAQGTFCFPDGTGGCFLLDPPFPNQLIFRDDVTGQCASIDYAGIQANYIFANGGPLLPTAFSGSVKEKPTKHPLTEEIIGEVTVDLVTTNALTWAMDQCNAGFLGTALFGRSPHEVLAGATATLGTSQLTIKFLNNAVGAPLPDLFQLDNFPAVARHIVSAKFGAHAEGELRSDFGIPDGTPGTVDINVLFKLAKKDRSEVIIEVAR